MGPNSFAAVVEFGSPLDMKMYIILLIAALLIGTLVGVWHRGNGVCFARRRERSRASERRTPAGAVHPVGRRRRKIPC